METTAVTGRRSGSLQLGRAGEDSALDWYRSRGYVLVARNWRCPLGELDLIVARGGLLVFCEVKTRRLGSGRPWDSLGDVKRAQVRRMARAWLAEVKDRPHCPVVRFDAIGVTIDARGQLVRLDHEEAAF
jgi:putative endonuclease